MDFRGSKKPPPYFNRRDQLRLFALCLALAVVGLAIPKVADPSFFAWMFPGDGQTAEGEPTPAVEEPLEQDDLEPVAGPEEFREEPPGEWMAGVRDDTVGILSTEHLAHYGLLARARAADAAAFEGAAEERPSRSVLMHNPGHYRGRLVTVEGELLRLNPMEVPEPLRSEYGLGRLWNAWIAMPDAPKNPVHVIVTGVPQSIPRGSFVESAPRVRATGWFLKREAFVTEEDLTRTPLLLGKTVVQLRQPVARVADPAELTPYLVGFAIAVAGGLAGMLFWFRAADRKFANAHIDHFTTAPEGAIEELADIETVDPAETMRRLAEEHAEEPTG